MWTSSAISFTSFIPLVLFILASANSYCYFHILFMYHYFYTVTFIFTLYAPYFLFFLIDYNQKQVLLIKWVIFFWSSTIFFCKWSYLFLKMVIFTTLFRRWSTLWKSMLKTTALFRRCLTLLISTLK